MSSSNSCTEPHPREVLSVPPQIKFIKVQLFPSVWGEDSSLSQSASLFIVTASPPFDTTPPLSAANTTPFFYVNIWITVPSNLSNTYKVKWEALFRFLMPPFLKNIYFPITEASQDRGDLFFTENHGSAFINSEIHPELTTPQISCLLLPRLFHPTL